MNFLRGGVLLFWFAASWGCEKRLYGQVVWQESFEASQDWNYVVSNRFYRNTNNYFAEVSVEEIVSDYAPYENSFGVKFFAAENTDSRGGDRRDEKTVLFNPVDTSGMGELTFSGYFASSSDPSQNRFERNDGAILFYSTDSGNSWEIGLSFVSERDTNRGRRGHLAQGPSPFFIYDTDQTETRSTIRGLGPSTGPSLSNQFTLFSFNIPEADEVIFKILLSFDGSNEEFAFDNFQLTAAIPEPGTYALMVGSLVLVLAVRNRYQRRNGTLKKENGLAASHDA